MSDDAKWRIVPSWKAMGNMQSPLRENVANHVPVYGDTGAIIGYGVINIEVEIDRWREHNPWEQIFTDYFNERVVELLDTSSIVGILNDTGINIKSEQAFAEEWFLDHLYDSDSTDL